MGSSTQRYPFSTADGNAIPSDIIKPTGLIIRAFTSSAATAQVAIASDVEVISFVATEDCIVVFGADASIPADGVLLANALFVPAGVIVQAAPPLGTFSAKGLTASGTLIAQLIAKWAGLTLQTQNTRG